MSNNNSSSVPKSTKADKVKLPCRIEVFFTYCRIAWGYCLANIVNFRAKSERYDPAYVESQNELVNSVENLPSLEARRGNARAAYLQLKADCQAARSLMKLLKHYIQVFYTEKLLLEAQLKAAGFSYFSGKSKNWGDNDTMFVEAKKYLVDNGATLMVNNNMPATFSSDFEAAVTLFKNSWLDYIAKEKLVADGQGPLDTGLKGILSNLQPMLELGKVMAEFDPLVRKKFTTIYLLNEVRGKHPAGVKGMVSLSSNGKPVENVMVSVNGDISRSVMTNENGAYELILPSGTYDIHFTSENTVPLTVKGKIVKPGVKGRLKVVLDPNPPVPEIA